MFMFSFVSFFFVKQTMLNYFIRSLLREMAVTLSLPTVFGDQCLLLEQTVAVGPVFVCWSMKLLAGCVSKPCVFVCVCLCLHHYVLVSLSDAEPCVCVFVCVCVCLGLHHYVSVSLSDAELCLRK